jgi:molecular chaperone GrpE
MAKHESELTVMEPQDAAGSAAAEETQATAPAETEVAAASRSELEQLKGERDQLLDRLARLQAEFENARKRAERERAEFRDYATGNVVEQFLPVLDNFELALKSTGSAEQLRQGVELIVKQMDEILRGLQVNPIATVGEQFDPRVHEALGSVERDDLPDQHVAEEIRRGYKLRERMLRPALVRVAHNPKQVAE